MSKVSPGNHCRSDPVQVQSTIRHWVGGVVANLGAGQRPCANERRAFRELPFCAVDWGGRVLNAPQRAMSISQAAARQIIIGAIALYVIVAVLG